MCTARWRRRSTPLMERMEQSHPSIACSVCPAWYHPQYGRHIELGVKGPATLVPLRGTTSSRGCTNLVRMRPRIGAQLVMSLDDPLLRHMVQVNRCAVGLQSVCSFIVAVPATRLARNCFVYANLFSTALYPGNLMARPLQT